MNIIITMAGEGRRFKEIGITKPKHMIEAKGKTLFEWAMLSLTNFCDESFIFITRKNHNALLFVREKCRFLGIKNILIKEIDGLTKGQAETALAAEEMIRDPKDSIIIYNIDTYVEPKQLNPAHIKGDGWVPAFGVEGDRWSFVKINENQQVIDVTEKVRISPYGAIGLYYFSSFNLYKRLYNEYPFKDSEERYIAPIYRFMIHDPTLAIYSHILDEKAVHVLGTPEDVQQFDRKFTVKKKG